MKKILIHILIIASAVYISFVFYRTIAIYSQIDTMKKTTALVNTRGYIRKNSLRASFETIDGVKQNINKNILLYRATGLFSIRQVPQINNEEEITYYEIEKCYFNRNVTLDSSYVNITTFSTTNIVGISTEKCQRSDFQLFLDIFSYYKNVLFYALFFLNCIFYCYVDNSNKTMNLFYIIYMIIFLFI